MSRHHVPHYHRSSRPHRPGQYQVYRARKRSQTLAMVATAGVGLLLLVVLVVLVEGGRDGFRHGIAGTLGDESWK